MDVIRIILLHSDNIERDSYIWNMAGSLLVAFQSVIMLMILTRTLGLRESGIFAIAYANANLFVTIGKYGMRYFQVSDVKNQFSFRVYVFSRIVTTTVMMIVAFTYIAVLYFQGRYTAEKCMVVLWMCLLKAVEAVEDVYHGLYQKRQRLDVAGKSLALRTSLTIVVFGLGVLFQRDLLKPLITSTAVSMLLFVLFTGSTFRSLCPNKMQDGQDIREEQPLQSLLRACFPLFIGAFLSIYIGNAPKYAIDSVLTDELQACYGFVAMPVFVIGLLNGFIFNPIIYKISVTWRDGQIKQFVRQIIKQVFIIILITAVCILGATICGIPVLSWLYNTDLTEYKRELLILLVGGGFLALSET